MKSVGGELLVYGYDFLCLFIDKETLPVLNMLYPLEELFVGYLPLANCSNLAVAIQHHKIHKHLAFLPVNAEPKRRTGADKDFVSQLRGLRQFGKMILGLVGPDKGLFSSGVALV